MDESDRCQCLLHLQYDELIASIIHYATSSDFPQVLEAVGCRDRQELLVVSWGELHVSGSCALGVACYSRTSSQWTSDLNC